MPTFNSPGVIVQENVQSAGSPTFSTSSAGIAGYSSKGRLDLALVTTQQQFLQEYTLLGQIPLGSNFHYCAMAYLSQGNQLYVQRCVHSDALYSGVRFKISTSGQSNTALSTGATTTSFVSVTGNQDCFEIFAKDPGVWGNNIAIAITNVNVTLNTFEIDVYITNPLTAVQTFVESWVVSRATQKDGYGNQQYMNTKINGFSQYIVVADNTANGTTVMPKTQSTPLALGGGVDGTSATDSDVATGWNSFLNTNNVDVRILINAGYTGAAVQAAMLSVVGTRKDCMAIFDIPVANTTTAANAVSWRTSTQNFNDQRAALYSPWLKVNDSWNQQIVTVPPSGHIAAGFAYNDYVGDVWTSPAGFTRGVLNVIGVSTVYSSGDRDTLYASQINPIQMFRGAGIVIYGDKNETSVPSVLDRINVRRSVDYVEKALFYILQQYLFQNNTPLTQLNVTANVVSFLSGLASGGAFNPIGPTGVNDRGYAVLCNSTNNTASVVNNHQLIVDVYIRPVQSINFILLRSNILDSTVSIQVLNTNGTLL